MGLKEWSKFPNFPNLLLNARVKQLDFLTFLKLNHGTVQFLLKFTIVKCDVTYK